MSALWSSAVMAALLLHLVTLKQEGKSTEPHPDRLSDFLVFRMTSRTFKKKKKSLRRRELAVLAMLAMCYYRKLQDVLSGCQV